MRPELEKLVLELADKTRPGHYYCEDTWYSCPNAPEGCCNDEYKDKGCNCGADVFNQQITELVNNLLQALK